MLNKPAKRPVSARIVHTFSEFKNDESGAAIGIFILFLFFIMLIFGGIAVDVMRFEMRRVAVQQTLDRAVLAAASLTQDDNRDATDIATDWFEKAGLEDGLTFDYSAPVITDDVSARLRKVTASARVTSYNHFLHLLNIYSLEGPAVTEAAQGAEEMEVMLVLDITGSMSATLPGDSKTKIQALRESADLFVQIVKENDKKNNVSIGLVPYAAQVNIPKNLREQFTNITNVSWWDGQPNKGVPNINCIEMPFSSYTTTKLPTTTAMPMAAVADTSSGTATTNYVAPTAPSGSNRICTTKADDGATPYNDELYNHVFLPTKDGNAVRERIGRLTAAGNTSIALGMRWGVALMDQEARSIYSAIGDSSVAGRPADNKDEKTRKIIVLMTDGEHVPNDHIVDAYKTGLSPIWRGQDGKFAIRYVTGGPALTGGTRPGSGTTASTSCSGWKLSNYANRTYFVPHLKRDTVKKKVGATEPEGQGTGTAVAGACDPLAWLAAPSWPGSGTTVQLDWSEVWRYVPLHYVARQLYMRSNVGGTGSPFGTFRKTYADKTQLDTLLQDICGAAKAKDTGEMEIYGIAFAAPDGGKTQIKNCATNVTEYFYDAQKADTLEAAFREIAIKITDLRLTQ